MLENLDSTLLARIQFAFTISFHILFPAFTIGLASWLAVLEWRWLKTGNQVYADVYRMWVKIFAVTFGMGVVSGVVMSFQFGTNWSRFADAGGSVLGPLLGYEVLTAFFLEASFLGVMLFGWNRVSPKMHFAATVIVAGGTLISAFWILSANSWMQTPQGFRVGPDGLLYPTSWLQVIFNPSFPYRFVHMTTAAYLTTAFTVAGIGAFYLWRQRHVQHARMMFGMAMIMAIFVAPMQLLFGDLHGLNTFEYQPAKVASMEGLWETRRGAPLVLFGLPDQEEETTKYAVEIPKLTSLILTHDLEGEVRGLKEWPADERPPVALVFWTFRIMVGIGMLMIACNRCDRDCALFEETVVRHPLVSVLVHGPDAGRVYRCSGRMVCHRSGAPAMDRPWPAPHRKCHLSGDGDVHRHIPHRLCYCLCFRIRCR